MVEPVNWYLPILVNRLNHVIRILEKQMPQFTIFPITEVPPTVN